MHVCANCAYQAARNLRLTAECAKLAQKVLDLTQELHDTDAAFWELAGDVRMAPIAVELKDDYVSVIYPASDVGERMVQS